MEIGNNIQKKRAVWKRIPFFCVENGMKNVRAQKDFIDTELIYRQYFKYFEGSTTNRWFQYIEIPNSSPANSCANVKMGHHTVKALIWINSIELVDVYCWLIWKQRKQRTAIFSCSNERERARDKKKTSNVESFIALGALNALS